MPRKPNQPCLNDTLRSLGPGESFFCPLTVKQVAPQASRLSRRLQATFFVAASTENNTPGTRTWRTDTNPFPALHTPLPNTYPIDHDIPVTTNKRGRKRIYPFPTMKVGESFFSPNTVSAVTGAHNYGHKNGVKFTTKRVILAGAEGVRVTRIA